MESRASKLMKGTAGFFACSDHQFSIIKCNEDVTEIHQRESQTDRYFYCFKAPGTLKSFRISPHKPTTYFMLILRDEEPLAQGGRGTFSGSQSQDSNPCLVWFFQGQQGRLLRDENKE